MSNQKSPRKRRGALEEQRRNLAKLDEKNVCDCLHTKPRTGDISVTPQKGKGKLRYICNECYKDLDLNLIPMKDLEEACSMIDSAIDAIKITLDPNRESDQKIHDHVSMVQYRVRNEICHYYQAVQKANNKNRGNGGGRNQSSSSWGKAEIRR